MTVDRKALPVSQRPFAVIIRGTRRGERGRYVTFIEADDAARALQKHGFDAHVVGPGDDPPMPRAA